MKIGIALSIVGLSLLALAKPAMPGHIPGDRLIANLTERLMKEPDNAAIYYLIGRAHYATFSKAVENSWSKKGEVEIFQRQDQLPYFYSLPGNIYPWDSKSAVEDTPDNRRHIEGAIKNLRIALEMTEKATKQTNAPADAGLAHLTLACTFDCGALLASKVKIGEPYKSLTTTAQWRSMAASEYLLAFRKSIGKDSKLSEKPIFGLETLVAYEAGESYLRLLPKSEESNSVRAGLEKLAKLPPAGAITPLVMDLSAAKPLSALLDPTHHVEFDLDGSKRLQKYGWVQPTTAFLVWDPYKEGKITSGRQLFGNATWWMLWSNAYAALDALDDNHDGWLSGKELAGLALWYDYNGNGQSDAGEVVPIEKTPIEALSTRFDSREGPSFVSSRGVKLKDGRVLPTYDWVTESIPH